MTTISGKATSPLPGLLERASGVERACCVTWFMSSCLGIFRGIVKRAAKRQAMIRSGSRLATSCLDCFKGNQRNSPPPIEGNPAPSGQDGAERGRPRRAGGRG